MLIHLHTDPPVPLRIWLGCIGMGDWKRRAICLTWGKHYWCLGLPWGCS